MQDHHDTPEYTHPSVLYLGADPDLPVRIAPLLAAQGIALFNADDRDGQAAAQPGFKYQSLIVDMTLLAPGETLKTWMDALADAGITAPHLVVITTSKDIGARLQALRANAAAYFVAPVATDELLATLVSACRPQPGTARRVLVVDDDAMQALLAERMLTAAGFQIRVLTDPLRILEILAAFQPHLVLMDLNMPAASGSELATIIREQDQYQGLPILFLSVERDPGRQLDALSMGGDAFINKPIRPDLLVKAVTQRIDASIALRRRVNLAEQHDPATGLATRHHFLSVLERAIAEPAGTQPGSGLLLVSLDETSQLAQRLGPGGLDLVRKRLGQQLRDQSNPTDLAVRLDDHYHALLIHRPGLEALHEAVEGLRRVIAGSPFIMGGQSIRVTLSIGVGLVRANPGDALTLISRAEKACAAAQRAGGDRMVVYQPSTPGPEDISHSQRIDTLIELALTDSTPDHGFRLYYQPLVAVGPAGRHCLEVLLRLTEPDGSLIPSWDFLPIAERSGRAVAIDHWVMMRALAVIAQQSREQPGLALLISQHLETLTAPRWVLSLRDQLIAHGLAPRAVILGVGINHLLENRRVAVTLAKMLRALEIKVCLLDVDQTPVVFDLVMELRPAMVRLANETVRQSKPEHLNVLVGRLRQLGTEIIAAGIDDPALIGPVWSSGIHYVQGTLIQPPLIEPVFDWDEVVVG